MMFIFTPLVSFVPCPLGHSEAEAMAANTITCNDINFCSWLVFIDLKNGPMIYLESGVPGLGKISLLKSDLYAQISLLANAILH